MKAAQYICIYVYYWQKPVLVLHVLSPQDCIHEPTPGISVRFKPGMHCTTCILGHVLHESP